jgi:hypothetical protein
LWLKACIIDADVSRRIDAMKVVGVATGWPNRDLVRSSAVLILRRWNDHWKRVPTLVLRSASMQLCSDLQSRRHPDGICQLKSARRPEMPTFSPSNLSFFEPPRLVLLAYTQLWRHDLYAMPRACPRTCLHHASISMPPTSYVSLTSTNGEGSKSQRRSTGLGIGGSRCAVPCEYTTPHAHHCPALQRSRDT